jgi:hypothetical protein
MHTLPNLPPATVRCRAQAATMVRQMHSGLSRKAETEMHPAAIERAGWWFRDAEAPHAAPSPEPTETSEAAAPADGNAPPAEFSALTEAEQWMSHTSSIVSSNAAMRRSRTPLSIVPGQQL